MRWDEDFFEISWDEISMTYQILWSNFFVSFHPIPLGALYRPLTVTDSISLLAVPLVVVALGFVLLEFGLVGFVLLEFGLVGFVLLEFGLVEFVAVRFVVVEFVVVRCLVVGFVVVGFDSAFDTALANITKLLLCIPGLS